jgi:hypothetical protein
MMGSFHAFMNFLGAVGTLMAGTGLSDVLEEVYGENAVVHMMSGKSVQRAFRGHLLVDRCLNESIVASVIAEDPSFRSLVQEAENMYSSLVPVDVPYHDDTSAILSKIRKRLQKKRAELKSQSQTCKLWIGYQGMINIARSLLQGDRTGSWVLHLRAMFHAMPIFAGAGHYNYLKSTYLYLQTMNNLENSHPEIYKKFMEGYRVIRHSNQFWSGIGCDLAIEQTLMRSLKNIRWFDSWQ